MRLLSKTWFQVLLIFSALLMISQGSWVSKTKGRKNKHNNRKHSYEVVDLGVKKPIKWYIDYDNLRPPECKDSKGLTLFCEAWRDVGLCEDKYDKEVMKRACPKTCQMCKAPAPIPCMNSFYGCCWDWQTKALTPLGHGCPKCRDKFRHLCPRFVNYCDKKGRNGKYIRYQCPATCGFCRKDQLVISVMEYKH